MDRIRALKCLGGKSTDISKRLWAYSVCPPASSIGESASHRCPWTESKREKRYAISPWTFAEGCEPTRCVPRVVAAPGRNAGVAPAGSAASSLPNGRLARLSRYQRNLGLGGPAARRSRSSRRGRQRSVV